MKNVDLKNESPATGIIQRSNEKSFFLKFHQGSKLADKLFEPNPKYNDKSISIIQMMLINEGYILVECVNVEDGL
jgi:hypothetical protein